VQKELGKWKGKKDRPPSVWGPFILSSSENTGSIFFLTRCCFLFILTCRDDQSRGRRKVMPKMRSRAKQQQEQSKFLPCSRYYKHRDRLGRKIWLAGPYEAIRTATSFHKSGKTHLLSPLRNALHLKNSGGLKKKKLSPASTCAKVTQQWN